MMPMVGLRYADTRDTIAESRYILCWGNNPAVTMHAYFKHYSQAQRNGARLVVIDPDLMKPQPKRTSGCRLSPVRISRWRWE